MASEKVVDEAAQRLATYAKPRVVKRGEDAEEAERRAEKRRKKMEGEARNRRVGNDGGGMTLTPLTKAQKKNAARAAKRAAKHTSDQ